MTHILLARHGETEWNVAGRLQGHTNSNLNDRGREQAQALAARLARLPISAIYSSDLTRALDTIAPAAALLHLPVNATSRLREKGFGIWEGQTPEQIAVSDPEHWHRYHVLREFDAPVPGGERWPEVQSRMASVLAEALAAFPDPSETVLIIGHGASLRTLITDTLGVPLGTVRHLHLDNVSLSRLHYPAGRLPSVTLLNDTSHLQDVL